MNSRRLSALVLAAGGLYLAASSFGWTHASWSDTETIADNTVIASDWYVLPSECPGSLADYNLIVGTDAAETLVGTNQPDLIFGLGGDDIIQGGNQSDCLVGGAGNDVIGGDRQDENGKDVLIGGPGDDVLRGGNGKDVLYSGEGMDTAGGDNGKDKLYGDAGNDTLHGGNGTDLMHGGQHTDTCTGGRAPDVYEECEEGDLSSLTSTETVPLQRSAPVDETMQLQKSVPVDDTTAEEETETQQLVGELDAEMPGAGAAETEQATDEESPIELEGEQP